MTDNEREQLKKEEHEGNHNAWIIGLCFAGAFLASLPFTAVGNRVDYWDLLFECCGGAAVACGLGLLARSAYLHFNNKPHKRFSLAVGIAVAVLLSVVLSRSILKNKPEFPCDLCGGSTREKRISYNTNSQICDDCFAENLYLDCIGYCENCNSSHPTEEMTYGLCTDCYEYLLGDGFFE